ncbi:MAG: hypothetical protein LBJ23_09505 [Tannerella sp.]|jgi:hypothetical protein|nr:hypothetical protein [Tannerella sp.]
MNKSELKNVAEDVFRRYPAIDRVFATSDGQVFFEKAHAENHASPNKKRGELEIESFLREKKSVGAAKNAKLLIEDIAAAADTEAVTAILDAERTGDNRKSVIDAAEKKIEKLKTQT